MNCLFAETKDETVAVQRNLQEVIFHEIHLILELWNNVAQFLGYDHLNHHRYLTSKFRKIDLERKNRAIIPY